MNLDENLEESIENKFMQDDGKNKMKLTIEESIYILKRNDFCRYIEEQAIETILNELEKKDKRISDLEYALMDMTLQFADEDGDYINTMGLSALETAFNELDFDEPMKISEVHKQYKELAKKYFK